MKKITQFLALILYSVFFLTACSNDDDSPFIDGHLEDYNDGVLVLNEGGIGSVTYISNDLEQVEQTIFQNVNNGEDLGGYTQSIFFKDDLAFIISNGSNLITVVNRYTFEKVALIDSGLDVPYYGLVENGKAYVTNLACIDTGEDDYIAVIDLETYQVENTITVGDYAENIVEENGKLYILNSNYGVGGAISVFNTATQQIENVIETTDDLNSFEIENGIIYALGFTKLQKIELSSGDIQEEISLAYGTTENPLNVENIEIEDDQIYFTVGKSVYTLGIGDTEKPEEPILTYNSNSEYGVMYGFEVEDNRIFIADGGDFASDSFVEVYDLEGNLLKNITVGIGPNGFYFNN